MTQSDAKKSKAGGRRSKAWWAERIEACEKSGMSAAEYTRANGLNLNSFYNWRGRLNREAERGKKKNRKIAKTKPIRFLEVSLDKPKSDATVEIASPAGWTIRMPSVTDAETMSRLIAAVEGLA